MHCGRPASFARPGSTEPLRRPSIQPDTAEGRRATGGPPAGSAGRGFGPPVAVHPGVVCRCRVSAVLGRLWLCTWDHRPLIRVRGPRYAPSGASSRAGPIGECARSAVAGRAAAALTTRGMHCRLWVAIMVVRLGVQALHLPCGSVPTSAVQANANFRHALCGRDHRTGSLGGRLCIQRLPSLESVLRRPLVARSVRFWPSGQAMMAMESTCALLRRARPSGSCLDQASAIVRSALPSGRDGPARSAGSVTHLRASCSLNLDDGMGTFVTCT